MVTQSQLQAEAFARGDLTFSTGKPCKRGHLSLRYSSNGGCVTCLNSRKSPSVKGRQPVIVYLKDPVADQMALHAYVEHLNRNRTDERTS